MTLKLVVTSGAALKLALPAWLAARTTVPLPVSVMVLPLTVAGPDLTLRTTLRFELDVGVATSNGSSPKTFPSIVVNAPIV